MAEWVGRLTECGAVRCGAVRCGAVQCGAVRPRVPAGPAALLSGPLEWGASLPLPEPWLEAMLVGVARAQAAKAKP